MKTIIIILFLTCCMVQVSYAQMTVNPISCAMDTFRVGNTKTPLTYTNIIGHTSTVMDIEIGTVDYNIATDPTGKKHIAIDWTTLTGKNPNISDLAAREFIINEILRSYGEGAYNLYYKEDCIKELTCTIGVQEPVSTSVCCEFNGDVSSITNQFYNVVTVASIFTYFDIKKKVVCGYKCCMDTYSIVNSNGDLHITRWNGQGFGASVTTCPENNDHHCVKRVNNLNPGSNRIVIPCEDEGCHQWK